MKWLKRRGIREALKRNDAEVVMKRKGQQDTCLKRKYQKRIRRRDRGSSFEEYEK